MAKWSLKQDGKPKVEEEIPKSEVKDTNVETVPVEDSGKPLVIASDVDAYIYDRMKGQPKNLDELDVRVLSKRESILDLPPELKKHQDHFTFRWINKNPRSISNALDVIGWNLVNRMYFKGLPSHLFKTNGSIERGDCILAFMSKDRADAIRRAPGEESRLRVQNTPIPHIDDKKRWREIAETREDFYKPDKGLAESDEAPAGNYRQPDREAQSEQVAT